MPQLPRQVTSWASAHPLAFDVLTAVAVAVVSLVVLLVRGGPGAAGSPGPGVVDAGLALAGAAALVVRRRWPGLALAGVLGVFVVAALLGLPTWLWVFPYAMAAYGVGAYLPLASGVAVLTGGAAAAVTLLLTGLLPMGSPEPGDAAAGGAVLRVAMTVAVAYALWWAGRSMRMRRAYVAELEARARRLERARDAHGRAVLAEERARIARELHDVIAHHVSVMTVQAAAAKRVLGSRPAEAEEALAAITETGRVALAEMRNLVGVLRTEDRTGDDAEPPAAEPCPGRSPQPGLAELDALAEQVREAGLDVRVTYEGDRERLSPGVDLTVYRIVQEALTNTLKHAGTGAVAEVLLRYEPRALRLTVRDDGGTGSGAAAGDPDRPGHGLVGMRERVALYGGELRAGPGRDGGYEVRARLPRGAETRPRGAG